MNRQLRKTQDEDQIAFGELGSSLGLLLRLAQVKVFDNFYDTLAQHGITPGAFTMLWVIGLNPNARQGVIARRLRIKPAHMTKLVQRAADNGFVERIVPRNDRRSVRLRLTESGTRFVQARKPDFMKFIAHENQGLSAAEFATLIRTLQKFTGMEVPK